MPRTLAVAVAFGACVVLTASLGDVAAAAPPVFCQGASSGGIAVERVGPSVAGISLALKPRHVAPGEVVYARLLNGGPNRATYGPEYRIEHRFESSWTIDSASPSGPWHKILWLLKSGSVGRCFRFTVPSNQVAGAYRFVAYVESNGVRSRRTVVFEVG